MKATQQAAFCTWRLLSECKDMPILSTPDVYTNHSATLLIPTGQSWEEADPLVSLGNKVTYWSVLGNKVTYWSVLGIK